MTVALWHSTAIQPAAVLKWGRAGLAGALLPLAVLSLAPALLDLWQGWTGDPLRSLGILIVLASAVLTLRAWRQSDWVLEGTWWGLVPVVLALLIVHLWPTVGMIATGTLILNLAGSKVALFLFASGVVLLSGGTRIWVRAWLPIVFLLGAKPVPMVVSRYLDLPLQHTSAHAARSFAALVGFPAASSQEMLRLMFTPSFGMFIAPGCNGVRGAVTLFYLALITSYLKKVSVRRWIAYACGGLMLGYLFNLFRLCSLVVYYRIASGHSWFEQHATEADYVIGGMLFLIAVLLFLWVVGRPTPRIEAPAPQKAVTPGQRRLGNGTYGRALGLGLISLLFLPSSVNAIRVYRRATAAAVWQGSVAAARIGDLMPLNMGSYSLNRSWQETLDGRVVIENGAYDESGAAEVVLGVWIPPGMHVIHDSWIARGEDPQQRSVQWFVTASAWVGSIRRRVLFRRDHRQDRGQRLLHSLRLHGPDSPFSSVPFHVAMAVPAVRSCCGSAGAHLLHG